MSIDRLHEKIRKLKNPTVLDFDVTQQQLPPHLLAEEGSFPKAYTRFCYELLEGLRGLVPAVRFSFGGMALLGTEGLIALSRILDRAAELGFYVLLDVPDALSAQRAQGNADILFSDGSEWVFDGLVISAYIGSDAVKPYAAKLEEEDKALFVATRTGNKSAFELQDLLTGGRHVYEAKTDIANRFKNSKATKSGYDRVAVMGPASTAPILRKLRDKYKNLFILVDGYDVSGANAKNCADAFDKFGHGAVVCAGSSITAAWLTQDNEGEVYVADAVDAAERMKKNLTRYFTVL